MTKIKRTVTTTVSADGGRQTLLPKINKLWFDKPCGGKISRQRTLSVTLSLLVQEKKTRIMKMNGLSKQFD